MKKLLVITATRAISDRLRSALAEDYTVLVSCDRTHSMESLLRHEPKVVVLDLGLAPVRGGEESSVDPAANSEGFACLESVMRSHPSTKVVVLTEKGERESAYSAIRCGAYDFYEKPVLPAELQIIIQRAFQLSSLEEQSRELQEALKRSSAGLEGIADHCAAMQKLSSSLQKVALVSLPGGSRNKRAAGAGEPENSLTQTSPGAQPQKEPELADEPHWSEERHRSEERHNGDAGLLTEHLTLREVRDRVEKGMVSAAVGNCGGNMVKASELLGVSRPALYDLMKKHGLFKRQGLFKASYRQES
jgi:DNA-binding NtrC family response regulator